jgi:uncharacterized protein YndB with AHSA1/START domain
MQKENVTITIEKIIKAPIQEVWRAWTDPSVVMQWFGSDPNGKVKNARLDVRQGGSFEVTFQDGDLTEHTCYGTYIEVKEDSALTFSWTWKSEPGVTSFIDLNLTSIDQQTSMLFKHSGVGTASAHNYEKGWADTFLKLERVLARQVL